MVSRKAITLDSALRGNNHAHTWQEFKCKMTTFYVIWKPKLRTGCFSVFNRCKRWKVSSFSLFHKSTPGSPVWPRSILVHQPYVSSSAHNNEPCCHCSQCHVLKLELPWVSICTLSTERWVCSMLLTQTTAKRPEPLDSANRYPRRGP